MKINHYKWLEKHLPAFFEKLGIDYSSSIIVAHGDKCYGYKSNFAKAGIAFPHGVAIYLLSYVHPFSKEVRQTESGWVDTVKWIIDNKDRFLPLLPAIDENDPDVQNIWNNK